MRIHRQKRTVAAVKDLFLFSTIHSPVLQSVDPVQVAAFLKERERYSLEVEAKQAQVPGVEVSPSTASIDRTLLRNLLFMGKFDLVQPELTIATVTDTHLS